MFKVGAISSIALERVASYIGSLTTFLDIPNQEARQSKQSRNDGLATWRERSDPVSP
jgi:hypothetical protein